MATKKIKMKIEKKPVAIGHQGYGSGAGFHSNQSKGNRQVQNRSWKKDQGIN